MKLHVAEVVITHLFLSTFLVSKAATNNASSVVEYRARVSKLCQGNHYAAVITDNYVPLYHGIEGGEYCFPIHRKYNSNGLCNWSLLSPGHGWELQPFAKRLALPDSEINKTQPNPKIGFGSCLAHPSVNGRCIMIGSV